MSAFSKSFAATLAKCTCEQINHPGHSCWWFLGRNLRAVLPSCAQYFVPLILIAPLRKLNNLTLDDIKDSVYNYCLMCFYVYCCSVAAQSMSCVLYNLQQRYTESMCMLPIGLGNGLTFLMPTAYATIVANSVMTMLTESCLMRDDTRFWRLIRNSATVRTVLFMCMGATIMDVPAYIKRTGIFWFIQPAARVPIADAEPSLPSPVLDAIRPTDRRVCLHAGTSCDRFIGSGVSTYLKVGISLEAFRLLFGRFAEIKSSPLGVVRVMRQHMNWRLIGFLSAYAALYRTVYCLLNRHNGKHTNDANLIAAFVSAASYRLYPNRTLLAHAIVSATRIAWLRLAERWAPHSKVVRTLNSLPWSHLLQMVGVAGLYHVRVFHPYWSPAFLQRTTSLMSGGSFEYMSAGTSKALLGYAM